MDMDACSRSFLHQYRSPPVRSAREHRPPDGRGQSNRVPELGCITGQLSGLLTHCGIDSVAVEVRPNLAAFTWQNLARFPNERVEPPARCVSYPCWASKLNVPPPAVTSR
jgi:hypothetical protein